MIKFTLKPAIFQQVDARRGDLFAVVADDAHYVVRAENAVHSSDEAATRFVRGWIGLDELGIPSVMGLTQKTLLTPCVPLVCITYCPDCAGGMKAAGDTWVCTECGKAL